MNRLAILILPRALRTIEAWSHELPVQSGSAAGGRLYLQSPFAPHRIVRRFRTRAMATGMLPSAA